jgi:acetolactate synthase-1/3 small subunit
MEVFRAKIVDSTPGTYTVEISGDREKVEAFINQLRPLGIKELVRSGRIAIMRDEVKPVVDQRRRPQMVEAK